MARQALLARADFMHAALLVKPFDGAVHVSARQLFNDGLQLWIALPHDLVEMRRADPRFLELVIRPAGVDRFMLAHVADEQHAVVWSEALQERVHLFRARQARFVEDVEALLVRWPCVVVATRQMPLQRARLDAGLGQLVGGAGRRREALDLVALTFRRIANRRERRRLPGAGGAFERRRLDRGSPESPGRPCAGSRSGARYSRAIASRVRSRHELGDVGLGRHASGRSSLARAPSSRAS